MLNFVMVTSNAKACPIEHFIACSNTTFEGIRDAALLFSEYCVNGNVIAPIDRVTIEELTQCVEESGLLDPSYEVVDCAGTRLIEDDKCTVLLTNCGMRISWASDSVEAFMAKLLSQLFTSPLLDARVAALVCLYAIDRVYIYSRLSVVDHLKQLPKISEAEPMISDKITWETKTRVRLYAGDNTLTFPTIRTMTLHMQSLVAALWEYL